MSRFSPYWLWVVLALPGLGMAYGLVKSTDPRIYHALLHPTGEFSARFLIITLMATPLTLLFKGWRAKQAGNPGLSAGAGAAAGFIPGMAGVGGPPAVAVALSRAGTTERQRANVIGSITGLNLCTIVPLYLHGLFTPTVIVLSVLIFPVYSGAAWLGARFFGGRGAPLYRNAALAVLALISAVTLFVSLRDLIVG